MGNRGRRRLGQVGRLAGQQQRRNAAADGRQRGRKLGSCAQLPGAQQAPDLRAKKPPSRRPRAFARLVIAQGACRENVRSALSMSVRGIQHILDPSGAQQVPCQAFASVVAICELCLI